MSYEDRKRASWPQWELDEAGDFIARPSVSPGKRTLTMSLPPRSASSLALVQAPVQQKADPAAVMQRKEQTALIEQWMDVALRPDLHDAPVQPKSAGDRHNQLPVSDGGHALPEDVQAKMEDAFGADFSAVRIHEGSQATAMGALAYTQGTDIHFAPGQYDPGSQRGQELLGHELAHVVQQSQGRVRPAMQARGADINNDPSLEQEADDLGARAARGERAYDSAASPASETISPRRSAEQRPLTRLQRKSSAVAQLRPITGQEKNSMSKLQQLAASVQGELDRGENKEAVTPTMPADIRSLKSSLEGQIAAVPYREYEFKNQSYKNSNDPESLMTTLWTLHIWTTDPERYAQARALSSNMPVRDVDAGDYKCNRLVGDANAVGGRLGYAENGSGNAFPTGERSWHHELRGVHGYPPSANELGNPTKRIPNTAVISPDKAEAGDIIAFPYPSGIGHSGIVLTDKLYISARHSEQRPGVDIQVADGLQITKIPGDRTATYRTVTSSTQREYPLAFQFTTRIPRGATTIHVLSNTTLKIEMNADYQIRDKSNLPKDFTFVLHHEDGKQPPKRVICTLGSPQVYIFSKLASGAYYLEFKPNGSSQAPIRGTGTATLVEKL